MGVKELKGQHTTKAAEKMSHFHAPPLPPEGTQRFTWSKFLGAVDDFTSDVFKTLFKKTADIAIDHPWRMIAIAAVVFCLTVPGMLQIQFWHSKEELWGVTGLRGSEELDFMQSQYGQYPTVAVLVEDGGNSILSRDTMLDLLALHDAIVNLKVTTSRGQQVTLEDFCFRTSPFQGCAVLSPLGLWNFDEEKIRTDKNLL